jgi:hypothetical protein
MRGTNNIPKQKSPSGMRLPRRAKKGLCFDNGIFNDAGLPLQ